MRNFWKFIRKHLLIYLSVLIFIILLDLTVFFLGYQSTVRCISAASPQQTLQKVSESLTLEDGAYALARENQEKLTEDHIWGLLIDSGGNVVWQYDLPKEIPLKYSLQDVAAFSKGYLQDYPVFTWKYMDGLLVLGYPKDSYSKFMTNYLPISAIEKAPFLLMIMLVSNITILFAVYYLSKRSVLLKVAPILNGIDKLSHGETVTLHIKGELEEIGEHINETSQYLKSQDQARANWISGVSHDIRTPLSTIMGYADKISTASHADESIKKQGNIIKLQSVKIKNLIQDLNLVSQLNYNVQPIQETQVYLCKMIREIVAEYLNSDLGDSFTFELDLAHEAEGIGITGDKRLLYRAIQNLISNSIHHNEKGCVIAITLQVEEDTLTLEIGDNGKGIPQEELRKLQSAPHYLQSTDDRLDLRHGLGLLLVKEIISIHKGSVRIESTLGQGFTTRIYLPVSRR